MGYFEWLPWDPWETAVKQAAFGLFFAMGPPTLVLMGFFGTQKKWHGKILE